MLRLDMDIMDRDNCVDSMPCYESETDPGELKICTSANELCSKWEMDVSGMRGSISGCQTPNKNSTKAGECEKVSLTGFDTTEICYCDTDGCNGTSNVSPQSFTVLLAITGTMMMLSFK